MTKTSQNINEICSRYANALILSSSDKSDLKKLNDNFRHFNKILENSSDLLNYINNPLINSKKKSLSLKRICEKLEYLKVFQGFLTVLTKHGKISLQKRIVWVLMISLDGCVSGARIFSSRESIPEIIAARPRRPCWLADSETYQPHLPATVISHSDQPQ